MQITFKQDDVIVVLGPRGCLPNSEHIYTPNGVVSVSSVYEGMPIEGGYVKDIHKFYDEIYEINVDGIRFKANGEHPLWLQKSNIGNGRKSFAPQWITVRDVYDHYQGKSAESRWYVQALDSQNKGTLSIGKKMAKMMGYLMSDGSFSEKQSAKFTNVRESLLNDFASLVIDVGNEYNIVANAYSKGNGMDILLVNEGHSHGRNLLKSKFQELGIVNRNTFGRLQCLIQDELVEFIKGYFNGDGMLDVSSNRSPEIIFYVRIHEEQAYELQFMLWRLGILSRLKKRHRGPNEYQGCWEVVISERMFVEKLLSLLEPLKYPAKFLEASQQLSRVSKQSNHAWHEGGFWLPIANIKKVGQEQVVGWDTLPSHQIVVSGGIKTHNSGKTTLIKYLVQSLSQYQFLVMDVVGNLKDLERNANVIGYFQINPHDTASVDEVFTNTVKEGNMMIVLDEADRYKYDKVLSDIVNLGRNYKLGTIVSARRCVVPTEYVYTPSGAMQAKDIREGQSIFGGNTKGIHSFKDQVYTLSFKGNKVRVNGEHPFLVRKIGSYPKTQWITAAQIYESYRRNPKLRWHVQEGSSRRFPMNTFSIGSDLAKIFGYLLSDGYISRSHQIKFTNTNPYLIRDFCGLCSNLGFQTKERISHPESYSPPFSYKAAYAIPIKYKANAHQLLMTTQVNLKDQIERLGLYDNGLGMLQQLEENDLVSFLSGYFNGGGTLDVSTSYPKIEFYVGIEERIAHQLQFMLWRLGIHSNIYHSNSHVVNGSGCWIVQVSHNASVKKLVSVLDDSKYPDKFVKAKILLSDSSRKRVQESCSDTEGLWVSIDFITKDGEEEVIGWETAPSHLIILRNGLVTHNTADLHKDFIANANYAFIFRDLIPQDLKTLTRWFGVDESVIRSLAQFEFLLFKGAEVVFRGTLPRQAISQIKTEQDLNSWKQYPPVGDRNNPFAYSIPPAPGIDWDTEGIHDVWEDGED